jgi:hypothetical protein
VRERSRLRLISHGACFYQVCRRDATRICPEESKAWKAELRNNSARPPAVTGVAGQELSGADDNPRIHHSDGEAVEKSGSVFLFSGCFLASLR